MMQYGNGYNRGGGDRNNRPASMLVGGILLVVFIAFAFNSCSNDRYSSDSAISWSTETSAIPQDTATVQADETDPSTVPWDYRIVEGEVSDLIGSDMTVLPDNEMLPNDNNYATGDKLYTLQYMSADMMTGSDGRNDVTLSAWRTIKSFPTKEAAEQDLEKLKVRITTETKLIGVYQTEYNGEFRQFAVLELPSGNRVKQPIDADRYAKLKTADKANIIVEEVHDFSDYDLTYAKFRGWAS
ncbi:hypothetical protein [Paenibacillus protaetiae]|uniref:Signal peptide protein n=1 Tax=Paenibacillus protaetiae TaxID=2509456 RepID=A0A4P6EXJ3_9BACL|nr:hypothetical protein [Paenibacillus protaetiae]QAY66469.1 signal peptide protein [Paenibacillus protaetiae]